MYCIIFLLVCFLNISCKSIKKVSDDIYKKQKIEFNNKVSSEDIRLLRFNRNRSRWYSYLDFSVESDTIYFLESYDVQGSSNLTIWNQKDTIHFYINQHLKDYNPIRNHFSKEKQSILVLITDWDIDKIRDLEKEGNSIVMLPRLTNYVSRVIFKNKKYIIDVFKFKDLIID